MIRVHEMYISPVKSLGLAKVERAYLDEPGIAGDRAFWIVDAHGSLFTQRKHGRLVQVHTAYDPASGHLELAFPDGTNVAGVPALGEAIETVFFGLQPVAGRVLQGDWNEALSEFAGQELRVVKADVPGSSFGFPLSMCSTGSLEALAQAAGENAVDGRRFRQNIYIESASAHEEDTWLDGQVRVGSALLNVKRRESRCAVTTHSPDTGETDMNTLKVIASYRNDQPNEVNFGVYCTVAEPGEAAVGDEVVAVD